VAGLALVALGIITAAFIAVAFTDPWPVEWR
jgi:hypothetical protein